MADNAPIRDASQFEPTPAGLAERWEIELAAADKAVETWHKRAKEIEDRYQDNRGNTNSGASRLNLFHGDVETAKALLYDNQPKVRVRRRNADADDDVARVSSDILDRLLNTDIEREDDGFATALEMARDDRLLSGAGQYRFRYVVEWEEQPEQPAVMDETGQELAPAVPPTKRKTWEDVETDYVCWEDFRWSPCRNWNEVTWVAFRAEMTLDECRQRFPQVDVDKLPVKSMREDVLPENQSTWARVEVWEIWDKLTRSRLFHCRGHNEILENTPDPLGLPGFFPCPRPLFANQTTRKLMPVPDFVLAQDLYDEIDEYTERIRRLARMARVAAAHDKNCEALARILDDASEGKSIPVENWAAFQQDGAFKGAIAFLPIDMFVNAVQALVQKRQECIQLLHQVTGVSDMQRGSAQTKTATQARVEARNGASRTRSKQKEFARFAQDGQRIRAQIIARWFDEETLIKRSNIEAVETMEVPPPPQPPPMPGMQSGAPGMPPAGPPAPPRRVPNRALIAQAVELLKSDISAYRIEIAEDSLAMTDYDAVQQERSQVIAALGGFLQAMMPMLQDPTTRPYVLKLAQWTVAGLRGSSQAESILDEAVRAAEKAAAAPKPPQPDPKAQQIQMQAQADMQKTKTDVQAHAAMKQIDVQAERAKQSAQAEFARPMPIPPGGINGAL